MPDVVWTLGANTLTWDKGTQRGPRRFDGSGVLVDRLAGGALLTYDLGISDLQTLDYTFPHVTPAKLAEFLTWKDQVAVKALNAFTHTDQSESPAFAKTVRLLRSEVVPSPHPDPSTPRFTVQVTLQVEPT